MTRERLCERCGYELAPTPEPPLCTECGFAGLNNPGAPFPLAAERPEDGDPRPKQFGWTWRWLGWPIAVLFTPRRYGRTYDLRALPWRSRRRLLVWGVAAPLVGGWMVALIDGVLAACIAWAAGDEPVVGSRLDAFLMGLLDCVAWSPLLALDFGAAACVFAAAFFAASRLAPPHARMPRLAAWCHGLAAGLPLALIGRSSTLWELRVRFMRAVSNQDPRLPPPTLTSAEEVKAWLDTLNRVQAAVDFAVLSPWVALAAIWAFGPWSARPVMPQRAMLAFGAFALLAGVLVVDWFVLFGAWSHAQQNLGNKWAQWTTWLY